MIGELQTVVLCEDIPEKGLSRGALGAVVLVHGSGEAYEVEFLSPMGDTVAVLTLRPDQVQPYPAQSARRLVQHASPESTGS
jgi:uncharacterized protein DUF4926